jgi:hypothetical protein
MSELFKKCTMCSHKWNTREDFLNDGTLVLNGYEAYFKELERGLIFFTHEVDKCGSTMTFEVKEFLDLYTGEIYPEQMHGTEECPEYCLKKDKLDACLVKCECASVREVLQIIKSCLKQSKLAVMKQ